MLTFLTCPAHWARFPGAVPCARLDLAEQLTGIDSLKLGELPDPVPGAGQALVRVHGAAVGARDAGFLAGAFPGIAVPFVPGQEVAGVVRHRSAQRKDGQPGTEVGRVDVQIELVVPG
jgi:NADPH:quinone reductase